MPASFEFSRDSDLTGFWSGEYWYDATISPTPFSAHLEDISGALTGMPLPRFGYPDLVQVFAGTVLNQLAP